MSGAGACCRLCSPESSDVALKGQGAQRPPRAEISGERAPQHIAELPPSCLSEREFKPTSFASRTGGASWRSPEVIFPCLSVSVPLFIPYRLDITTSIEQKSTGERSKQQ